MHNAYTCMIQSLIERNFMKTFLVMVLHIKSSSTSPFTIYAFNTYIWKNQWKIFTSEFGPYSVLIPLNAQNNQPTKTEISIFHSSNLSIVIGVLYIYIYIQTNKHTYRIIYSYLSEMFAIHQKENI